MKHLATGLQTILFDYGNTLIEFGPDQVSTCDRALSSALDEMFGSHDFDQLTEIMHAERRAPYSGEFVENCFDQKTRYLVKELFGESLSQDQLDHLLEVRFQVMTGCIQVQPQVADVLQKLSDRFRLGLISNYPDGRAIRHSLELTGLVEWFEVIVVSADIGHVKPHPRVFETALEQMDAQPESTLYVGDNWLGDIQGSKRHGMKAVWTQQFVPYEVFEREDGDHAADAEISNLTELLFLLD